VNETLDKLTHPIRLPHVLVHETESGKYEPSRARLVAARASHQALVEARRPAWTRCASSRV
jgi:hypothetical protein